MKTKKELITEIAQVQRDLARTEMMAAEKNRLIRERQALGSLVQAYRIRLAVLEHMLG